MKKKVERDEFNEKDRNALIIRDVEGHVVELGIIYLRIGIA